MRPTSSKTKASKWRWAFFGLAILITVGSIRLYQAQKFEDAVTELTNATPATISTVCLTENYECVERITDKEEIALFLAAVKDMEKYSPQKASVPEANIALSVEPINLSIHVRIREEDDFAIGSIGGSRLVYGSFRSKSLRDWAARHLEL